MSETFYDDQSQITQVSEFSYSDVERGLGEAMQESDYDSILACQRKVWAWAYQPPCTDLDGFMCRCIILCWVFVPQLRAESMTYIAGRFGKKKQSLGRWAKSFKQEFPEVANHIQHLRHHNEK